MNVGRSIGRNHQVNQWWTIERSDRGHAEKRVIHTVLPLSGGIADVIIGDQVRTQRRIECAGVRTECARVLKNVRKTTPAYALIAVGGAPIALGAAWNGIGGERFIVENREEYRFFYPDWRLCHGKFRSPSILSVKEVCDSHSSPSRAVMLPERKRPESRRHQYLHSACTPPGTPASPGGLGWIPLRACRPTALRGSNYGQRCRLTEIRAGRNSSEDGGEVGSGLVKGERGQGSIGPSRKIGKITKNPKNT